MKCGVIAVLSVLLLADAGRADIIEWQDAHGVRHFTNRKAEMPAATVRVVVSESAPSPSAPCSQAPAAAPEEPRQAQVVYDYSAAADAYVEGLERGLALGAGAGGAVQINGPLAIANAYRAPLRPAPVYSPWITTSFDRGRSRHRTLRMRLQDQFQQDRDGRSIHRGRLPVGNGVVLGPLLSRRAQRVPCPTRVSF
ncbi:MAG: DUF4124 domain-containing protein [Deltaproteobacteria bacterium]|nr:DUF4124 domain-containing protein [Deltaproteobacteria bacterium]